MTKLYSTIVLAIVSLVIISLPKMAIAEPAESQVEDVALTENWKVVINKKSVLAFKNNNPGNLRYVGQKGASKGYGGFAYFENSNDGFTALIRQIKLDASRGLTVEQFIHKYAPPFENDTSLYLEQVLEEFEIEGDYPLHKMPVNAFAIFVAKKESNSIVILP